MRPRLLTRSYALTCAATFLFYLSVQMQIPLFPAFLRARTGARDAVVGAFIGSFTALAVLARPWVGRELAHRARRPFMAAGGALAAAAALGYWAAGTLPLLFAIRVLHGPALAAFYTGASTAVADLAPPERRGEALSLFSMFLYFGLAAGPPVGRALAHHFGFGAMFAVSAALGAGCGLTALAIREPRVHSPEAREIERRPLVHRAALFPGAVLMLAAAGYGVALNFTADFADAAGIAGVVWYFPVLSGAVIGTRLFAGRLSDRFGRIAVAAPGLALFTAAMALEASAGSIAPLLASAALFGTGFGMFFPTMMAYTTDRVPAPERGSAMATFTASFDVGFGLGSPALAAIKGAAGYPAMFGTAAGLGAIAFALLLSKGRVRPGAKREGSGAHA